MNTRLLSYLVGYQVALTGSRALGRHTENSDWDFLIGLLPEDIEPLLDTLWRAGFRIEAPKDSDVKDPPSLWGRCRRRNFGASSMFLRSLRSSTGRCKTTSRTKRDSLDVEAGHLREIYQSKVGTL